MAWIIPPRSATEVARAAAYQAAGLSLDLKARELGVDANQNAQIMEGIKTQLSQRKFNATMSLKAQAAQGAGKPTKLSNKLGEAITGFETNRQDLQKLFRKSKSVNAAEARAQRLVPGYQTIARTPEKEFDELAQMQLMSLLRAMSGLTVNDKEYQRYVELTPQSTETESVREGKIFLLLRNAASRGAANLRTASAQEKAEVASRSPELYQMLSETNPGKRDRLVYSFMTGQSGGVPESFDKYKRDLGQ